MNFKAGHCMLRPISATVFTACSGYRLCSREYSYFWDRVSFCTGIKFHFPYPRGSTETDSEPMISCGFRTSVCDLQLHWKLRRE
uniref:Uncharacterized protein n=1 Tax=Arundo donax TaxID=35708 RepID=A0A0A9DYB3_ARUDO